MKSVISILIILVSLTSVGHAQITRLGRAGPLLEEADIAAISRLAATSNRKLWLVDAHRGQVLPETWTVYAYLTPQANGPQIRRGRFVTLESLVKAETAQRWRVTSRDGDWAQVALANKSSQEFTTKRLTGRFTSRGRFSDVELISLVEFIRSSPRMPPIPDAPDGTSFGGFDEVRGHLPISSIGREQRMVVVRLRSSHTSWQIVALEWLKGQWQIRELSSAIA